MRYEDIRTHQDAIDMLEAELITMQDYINICYFNKWPTHDAENKNINNANNGNSKSNVIQLKVAYPKN